VLHGKYSFVFLPFFTWNYLSILNRTIIFYTAVLVYPSNPSKILYELFKGTKVSLHRLLDRDVVTSISLCSNLLSGSTHSVDNSSKLVHNPDRDRKNFLFMCQNIEIWKIRRLTIVSSLRSLKERIQNTKLTFKVQKGTYSDLNEEVLKYCFKVVYECLFGENLSRVEDLNNNKVFIFTQAVSRLVKRQIINYRNNTIDEQSVRNFIANYIKDQHPAFLFKFNQDFCKLDSESQVSTCLDIIVTAAIQSSDLICHILLELYILKNHEKKPVYLPDDWIENSFFFAIINEIQRLYPLSDCFFVKGCDGKSCSKVGSIKCHPKSWIAPLTLLNRNGIEDPDEFKPQRWISQQQGENKILEHVHYSVGARNCPAFSVAFDLTKLVLRQMKDLKIGFQVCKHFHHDRSFWNGIPVFFGEASIEDFPRLIENRKPFGVSWSKRFTQNCRVYIYSLWRILEQREIW